MLSALVFLVLVLSTLSYQSLHRNFHRHKYITKHHDTNNNNDNNNSKLFMNKADEILQRRNKTEIFNVAFSDEADECGLDGGLCSDTPKSWSTSNASKPASEKQVDNKNKETTPIWLEDDNDSEIEHTPKAWIKK